MFPSFSNLEHDYTHQENAAIWRTTHMRKRSKEAKNALGTYCGSKKTDNLLDTERKVVTCLPGMSHLRVSKMKPSRANS